MEVGDFTRQEVLEAWTTVEGRKKNIDLRYILEDLIKLADGSRRGWNQGKCPNF